MLKRPRRNSPSPARQDPSPPLDSNNLQLRASKRLRTAGPILESNERRHRDWSLDDGEDYNDYDGDRWKDTVEEFPGDGTYDKAYAHMNNILHTLHAEQQHRSRSQSTHFRVQHTYPYRDNQSPALLKEPQTPYHERAELRESDGDDTRRDRSQLEGECALWKTFSTHLQDDERLRVTHRYEDTNRLLGSLVQSRRRALGTSVHNIE